MGMFLFLIGFVGVFVSSIMLIVQWLRKKPTAKLRIALLVCFVLCIVGIVTFDTGDAEDQSEDVTVAVTETVETTEAPTDVETTETVVTIDSLAKEIEKTFAENWDDFTVTADGNVIMITFWAEGFTEVATAAKAGDQTAAETWQSLIDTACTTCKTFSERTTEFGYSANIKIVDENNMESTLAFITDGFVLSNVAAD